MSKLRTQEVDLDAEVVDEATDGAEEDSPSLWEETVKAIAEAVAEGRRRPH